MNRRMFKLTLYCLSVSVQDLDLRCEDKNILSTCYFVVLDSTLNAR